MANTAAQELWTEGKCFACVQINSNFIVMLLSLLNRGIVAAGGNAMTAQELMTEGSCFACIPDMTQGEAMALAAMNELVDAINTGGGGGGLNIRSGTVDPVGVVTPTAANQIYINKSTPTIWISTGVTSADWQQIT